MTNLIKTYQLKNLDSKIKNKILKRSKINLEAIKKQVVPIIEAVKNQGDQAIENYLKKFDDSNLKTKDFRITDQQVQKAYKSVSSSVINIIREQIRLSKKFNQEQYRRLDKFWQIETVSGVKIGQKINPIQSVGLYIPGGQAAYPSTMQMLAVPAKAAGVKRIVAVTPPRKNNYELLIAAQEAGVDEIYQVGGVAAIAALTYGTKVIKPVLKIVGPGNIYVTAAKMLVFGDVNIDMPAGPSEVLILADGKTNPVYCAADLLAQAEHDTNACGTLLTTSKKLAKQVNQEINKQLNYLSRQKIIKTALKKFSAILIADNQNQAVDFINQYAPEHLEILTKKPYQILPKIKNSGSIFLGYNCPVPVGDYASGTNHVLPTMAGAKSFSPINIETFMKKVEFQSVNKTGLKKLGPIVKTLSEVEGLDAHWQAVKKRLEGKND